MRHHHKGPERCQQCGTSIPHVCWQSGVMTIMTLSDDLSVSPREDTDDLSLNRQINRKKSGKGTV